MDFKKSLDIKCDLVNSELIKILDKRFGDNREESVLYKSCRHALLAGGKRIRPALVLNACEICGGEVLDALYAAVAMEYIHTYSLIHDDLPAMDNADLRRGKPTIHTIYNDGIAVLAGDTLLTEAFAILAKGPENKKLDASVYLDVIRVIAEGAGVNGMVSGQELDLQSEGKQIDFETLKKLHYQKTAAMIRASLTAGAMLGGGSKEQVEKLYKYGEKIGLAFQIKDDLLDIEGSPEEIGKTTGGDQTNEKATYPALIGLSESKQEMMRLVDEATGLLESFGDDGWFLRHLAVMIAERTK